MSRLCILILMSCGMLLFQISHTMAGEVSKDLGIDARAYELLESVCEELHAAGALSVETTTEFEFERGPGPQIRQRIVQSLHFRRPNGLAIRSLPGSTPAPEIFFLHDRERPGPNTSVIIPGAGIISRRMGDIARLARTYSFGYDSRRKTNFLLDQNLAAAIVRDLLVPPNGERWEHGITDIEYLAHEKIRDHFAHRIRVEQESNNGDIIEIDFWISDDHKPKISQVSYAENNEAEASTHVTASYANWNFSPALTDDRFETPPNKLKSFRSYRSAIRAMAQDRRRDSRLRQRLIGTSVSDVTLTMLDGTTVNLESLRGDGLVILDFWATWSRSCVNAIPIWHQILQSHETEKIHYFAVNQGEFADDVQQFVRDNKLSGAFAIDPKRTVGAEFQVKAIPQTIVIDKDGVIAAVYLGVDENNRETVAAEIATLADFSEQLDESPITILRERQARVKEVIAKVSDAVVGIQVGAGGGSGVIVDKDGLILTAAHVSMRPNQKVLVYLADGRQVSATTLGADHNRDAGMVKIDEEGEWPFAEIGDSNQRLGDWVITMGHPGGYAFERPAPIRIGRIIKLPVTGGTGRSFLATDCTVTMGDSGGPLFDLDGKVIGIHSFISQRLVENMHVPIGAFKDNWQRMLDKEIWGRSPTGNDRARGVLGVYLKEDKSNKQVIVESVVENSPAETAGIQENDVIISIGDLKEITSIVQFRREMQKHRFGEKIVVVFRRGTKDFRREVTLAPPNQ